MEIIQYRQAGEPVQPAEERHIEGYGIVFNSDSLPLMVWDGERAVNVVEQITPEAMRDADMSDVISAYNHNFEKILGRTSSGTMTISTDKKGIKYRVDAPDTSYGNDVLALVSRGDVRGSSFVFTMDFDAGYEFSEREDGSLLAIPKKINRVYEMGPVTRPAYPETTAENRSAMLEQAVKRFLKEKQEKRDEEAKTQNAEEATQEQKREENQTETVESRTDITYPNLTHYKYKVRVNKHKKRV